MLRPMLRPLPVLFGAALLTATAVITFAPPASSVPVTGPDGQMLTALQRDLQLSPDQARDRLVREDQAALADRTVRKAVPGALGGTWYDARSGKLVAGITADGQRAKVVEAGAEPRRVARSEAQLNAWKARLDARLDGRKAPAGIPGWYVDLPSNRIVVSARTEAVGKAFVRSAGVPAGVVHVVRSNESPRAMIDVVGGNAYYIGSGTRCSIGFSVSGGFVTAGHCGRQGATTTQPSGQFRGSSFPGNDYAWVAVGAGNTMIGAVNNYSGGRVAVGGSQDAPVGSSICRSGSTTGWRCGTIQARNATVTYPEGTITGLIRTSACAEPGDSGGSAISGNQAQGVTSGGSGNCRTGGTTYFQPVNEILQAYGLTLITSGGGDPTPPPTGCTGLPNNYSGSLAGGGNSYQPNGSYYTSTVSGTHRGCLDGPTGADFDLYLQKWNGSAWASVASSTSPGPDETVTYNGTAGSYRWRIHAYSGSGTYRLGTSTP
ncbi:S1 family peptidase [Kribbella deserti]|uniref:S1 family peptidase n=1 Tax=Kribbella deserti TaxID=1926257 RepID=A0ABV6QGJ0_9ACTN